MPWIVTSYKSKHAKKANKMKATFLFNETEIGRLAAQPDYCYTVVNTTSRRVSKVGGACRKSTPQGLWGLRDGAPAAAAAPKAPAVPAQPVAGWWPFGKKKPKQLPRDSRRMAQTVMYIPGEKGMRSQAKNAMSMRGARRRRRRR